jgi:hypothetical protein
MLKKATSLRQGSYEKASQGTGVTGTNFLLFMWRHALIRTLDGSAFDPVHARVRRGVLQSTERTVCVELSGTPVQALARSHPDGTSKNN